MGKLSGAFENTAVFGFFLFLFLIGLIWASHVIGMFIRPQAQSLGTALEAA